MANKGTPVERDDIEYIRKEDSKIPEYTYGQFDRVMRDKKKELIK